MVTTTGGCMDPLARAGEGLRQMWLLELLYLHHATWQIGSCRSLGEPGEVVESQRRGRGTEDRRHRARGG
jgi:hypothetical protein